jgi:hypothetical protein
MSTQDLTPEDKTNPNSPQAASGIVPAKRLTDEEELSIFFLSMNILNFTRPYSNSKFFTCRKSSENC